MLIPAYSTTATERVLPRLALDFTTGVLDARVTVVRALNTATRINSAGSIEIVNANLPRFDYDPSTLVCRGLLIEAAATNLFLNSLIDGSNLTTQSVTLSAVAYTLSFYGSGSIDITGGHTATVAGTGGFPSRKTYTFTPSAGSSTFTVSGTVSFAQLETGSLPTSFVPTAGTSVTRNADTVTMTGTNFSAWYNQSEGAIVVQATSPNTTIASGNLYSLASGDTIDPRINVARVSATVLRTTVFTGGSTQATLNLTSAQQFTHCMAYKKDSFAAALNGGAAATDTLGNVPSTVDKLHLGKYPNSAGGDWNGHIQRFFYYPQRLIDGEVRAFSKGS